MSDDTSWGVEPRHAQHHAQVSADVPVTPDAPAALLSDAELAAIEARLERSRSGDPLAYLSRRNIIETDVPALLAHIDALTSERDALRREMEQKNLALLGAALFEDSETERAEKAEAERDALQARLDAAAAELHTLRFRIEAAEFAAADRVQRRTRRVPDCEHGCDLDTFGTHQDDCPIDAARITTP